MWRPFALVGRPAAFSALALVSVLHTSITARAQAPGAPRAPAATSPSAAPAAGDGVDAVTREQARTAYTAGKDAYAAHDYAAASAHFARADELIPAVQAKYWRAMSLDQLGDAAAAYEAFSQILAHPDKAQLDAEAIATAEERVTALSKTPADLSIATSPAGAHVRISGVDVATLTPLTLRLAPGRHMLEVSLPGYETQQVEISATPGAKLNPSLTLLPGAVAPPPPDPSLSAPPTSALPDAPPERSRIPGYVTLGVAGASAVVGAIFGVRALGDEKDFNDNPSSARADDVERNALIADMAFGVTLTLGITGIVLLVADDPPPDVARLNADRSALARRPERARLELMPYASPKGAGAAASLSF